MSVFSSAMQFTIIFPFLPYMVLHLGGSDNRSETGYWAGLIAGSIQLGRALSAPLFGYLADYWGRKPVLSIALVTSVIGPIAFGFSDSL